MAMVCVPTVSRAADAAAPTAVAGVDDAHHAKAKESIKKGIAFLKSTQGADGSWSPRYGPAITALAIQVILADDPNSIKDPAVQKGVAYVMSKVQPDGGIYGMKMPENIPILQNYNTAIALSMLSLINDKPEVAATIKKAQDYLRGLQWSGQKDPHGATIDEKHPFYGGAGYGKEGRPDMSNTTMMIEGLHDSGLDCNDPAYKRAMVFISRCQAADTNTGAWRDKLSNDGGFIYSTSQGKDKIGVPESKPLDETVDVPGKGEVKILRSYGSMTYAGFKSYVYAKIDKNDPRVKAAWGWITKNYTVEENPGFVNDPKTGASMSHQGYYYYLMTFGRALSAWGEPEITTADGKKHNWANELIDKVSALQKEDGSWMNETDKWNEGDPAQVTAFAIIALEAAAK
jgi:squalene-hopene/tetraprenyl-beta-curcumene cyclase